MKKTFATAQSKANQAGKIIPSWDEGKGFKLLPSRKNSPRPNPPAVRDTAFLRAKDLPPPLQAP